MAVAMWSLAIIGMEWSLISDHLGGGVASGKHAYASGSLTYSFLWPYPWLVVPHLLLGLPSDGSGLQQVLFVLLWSHLWTNSTRVTQKALAAGFQRIEQGVLSVWCNGYR